MKTIAIVGASGYIGRHLVAELLRFDDVHVKVLTRGQSAVLDSTGWPSDVEVVNGDLYDEASLHGFFEADCTVINLVYLWSGGEFKNLVMTRNLIAACKIGGVKRLVHCSTAAVVGRVADDHISENTECQPITEYGITKLKIEQEIIRNSKGVFETVILRPTGVFGPGGEPLKKLANDLVSGNRLRNYLKLCFFGKRRMNLVHIKNVVAAFLFLIRLSEPVEGDVFIVSDDVTPGNNFADIERFLMSSFGCASYALPPFRLPLGILSLVLRGLGRNNINPRCNYDQGKLESIGFSSPMSFENGLSEYADWYGATQLAKRRGMVK